MMEWWLFPGLFALGYATFILAFYAGWRRLSAVPVQDNVSGDVALSVVIPFRNEAENLPLLFAALEKQSLPFVRTEWIFVDDHSGDHSPALVKNWLQRKPRGRLVQLDAQTGKKAALHAGIIQSRFPFIAVTDADCQPHSGWLQTIARYFKATNAVMLLGPVEIYGSTRAARMQALEFSSLIAAGAGACGLNQPIMANGANMAFRKPAYLEVQGQLPTNVASGDDMFLLHALKRKAGQRIAFMKAREAGVRTKAAGSAREFLQQRIRWTAKSPHYRDVPAIATALLVLGMSVSLLFALFAALYAGNVLPYFVLLLTKSLPDALLLWKYHHFFGTRKNLRSFLPLQLLYPFYVAAVSFLALTGSYQWKDRKHRK